MNENSIFIFEFVSGGGFSQVDIPSSLFCEGYGMLRCIIADFKALGFEIFTLLDHRIEFLSDYLEVDFIKVVDAKDNYIKIFKDIIQKCKYCFIIAPEFSNILYDLTKIARNNDKTILSVDLEGIKLGSSKIKTYNFFKEYEILTPKTYLIPFKNDCLDLNFIIQKFKKLQCPIIIKPEDGVGAESIYYFENEYQISNFFQEYSDEIELNRRFILQEYIEGRDLSVSLIGRSNSVGTKLNIPMVLSINSQDIKNKNLRRESEYLGGYTPVEDYREITDNLSSFLNKIDLSKFQGYFGIDFIRSHNKSLQFIEINPRLTTSYIGLRKVLNENPVKLIVNSKKRLLDSVEINCTNYSIFSRSELNYLGNESPIYIKEELIPKIMEDIPEIVTPPISFDKPNKDLKNIYSCFIATKEKNLKESRNRISKIMKTLKILDFNQKN